MIRRPHVHSEVVKQLVVDQTQRLGESKLPLQEISVEF